MRNRRPEKGPFFFQMFMNIFVLVFAVIWTALVARGAPFMAIFGIFFIGFAIARIVMTVKYAAEKDRRTFSEEPENRYAKTETPSATRNTSATYCPYCGAKVESDFAFCGECGRKLPDRQ